MARYIDADALKSRMLNYYDCVSESTDKSNYRGETLMNYEVADMIEDCIENAPTADVAPRAEVAREIFEEIEKIINKNYESALNNEEDEELEAATDYMSYISCDLEELKKKHTDAEPPKGEKNDPDPA